VLRFFPVSSFSLVVSAAFSRKIFCCWITSDPFTYVIDHSRFHAKTMFLKVFRHDAVAYLIFFAYKTILTHCKISD
jgi:hypothetical protein